MIIFSDSTSSQQYHVQQPINYQAPTSQYAPFSQHIVYPLSSQPMIYTPSQTEVTYTTQHLNVPTSMQPAQQLVNPSGQQFILVPYSQTSVVTTS